MITDEQYEEFVRTLLKPSEQLDAEITENEMQLLEIAKGLCLTARESCFRPECERPVYLNLLHMASGLESFLEQWNEMYPTNTITLYSAKEFNM